MTVTFKKLTLAAAIVAMFGAAGFLYVTRPLAAPSDVREPAADAPETKEGQKAYRVDSGSSRVTFTLNEVLSGQPTEVVGVTNQVTADFVLDTERPAASSLGTVRVNARSLKTDSTRRDGAIGRFILKSEDPANEFIVFEAKALEGLPEKIDVDAAFTFSVKGDLTIAGITKEVEFDGTATLEASGQLKGAAQTTVQRADYNLIIPSVPFVANVDQEVRLEIEFVANHVAG
ncbi:MAG: YceI family protein [Patescibacteria group bacterium]|nr:MAG: YceI family protein [Patescibacteria group bacterium]